MRAHENHWAPKKIVGGGGTENQTLRRRRRVKIDSYGNLGGGIIEVAQESKKSLGPQFYVRAKFRKLKVKS